MSLQVFSTEEQVAYGALKDLVRLHEKFMSAQGGQMGNQADAYNIIASSFKAWETASAAVQLLEYLKEKREEFVFEWAKS